jgi:hypothetical protein
MQRQANRNEEYEYMYNGVVEPFRKLASLNPEDLEPFRIRNIISWLFFLLRHNTSSNVQWPATRVSSPQRRHTSQRTKRQLLQTRCYLDKNTTCATRSFGSIILIQQRHVRKHFQTVIFQVLICISTNGVVRSCQYRKRTQF